MTSKPSRNTPLAGQRVLFLPGVPRSRGLGYESAAFRAVVGRFRATYPARQLQPQIPPHLPILKIEHQHPPAVIRESDVLRGEVE
jgi:hypothetical protein